MEKFDQTYSYKVIYVISMPYDTHKGLLKVGDATLTTDTMPKYLTPNCRELNQAALARIKSYTDTASIRFDLLYTELAVKTNGAFAYAFRDKKVHDVLMNSHIRKVCPNGETGIEWFETDLETVKAAIQAVKDGKKSLSAYTAVSPSAKQVPIDFRDEQKDAVEKTLKNFKKSNEMLWYAKMRFGKTLTALEVVRRSQYRRVIIVTHRPVVDDGWSEDFHKIFFPGNTAHDYLYERKTKDSAYTFDAKIDAENDIKIRRMDKNNDYFIYFASIQDLRGSELVGGNFNKNNAVFALDWDMIIIDEAHEGTQTELGDNVIKALRKKNTKVLALSGTPFNLLGNYAEESVYTWDYVMEQKKKDEWDLVHHGDHNPYADLPKMHIFTYNLGDKLRKYVTDEYETKAFNFREFFRVWYKGPNGKRQLPPHAVEGCFVHENDVKSFLNLMTTDDSDSIYPFSTPEFRNMFRHTLWMVPGVKEASALEGLLREHPVFRHFGIANVAGDGYAYEKDNYKDALEKVRATIKNNEYSITLSCGKLTTGVTVPEWTAAIMLSGTYSTAAAQYMQTIFRVQSAGSIDGKQKTDCYVFDFAPDRTLKVLTETVHLSRKPGKSQEKRRQAMTEFLNYCPVIAIQGSHMHSYSVNSMMEQIKQIYAERAVNSGFEDESIYNDELLKLDNIDAAKFNNLKDIIGSSKAEKKKDSVVVNGQGLTDEQVEHIDDSDTSDSGGKEPLSPEEIAERLKKKQAKEARKKAIDILRGISIRMPLMIYGADVPIGEDIDIDRFVNLVDETSWAEFMPNGVTKKIFADFIKYYDRDVFIAAGKRIRKLAAAADKEPPTTRVKMIAEIFRHFKNPDKETVLTPWRVVNMHMSDTLGGWCFFNEQFEDDTSESKHRLEQPRFVDRGKVTKETFGENAKILEINSKSGLYPLYVAYSCYRQRLEDTVDEDWEPEELWQFWSEVISDNIFVICKTPMAKSITRRTLAGYSDVPVNAHYFDDLVNQLKSKPEAFRAKILRESYWKKGNGTMVFDAVVGNPPYQETIGSVGNESLSKQLYPIFIESSIRLNTHYVSLITPSRWFVANAQDGSFPKLREFVKQNLHFSKIVNYNDDAMLFKHVSIGEINYFLYDKEYSGNVEFIEISPDGSISKVARPLFENGSDIILSNNRLVSYINKIVKNKDFAPLSQLATGRNAFGIVGKNIEANSSATPFPNSVEIRCAHESIRYIDEKAVTNRRDVMTNWKVFTSKANGGAGMLSDGKSVAIIGKAYIGKPNSVCTDSLIPIGCFQTEYEALALQKYMATKFLRFMVGILKASQNLYQVVYAYVPNQDFSPQSDIDWSQSISNIDQQLYAKYHLSQEEIDFIDTKIKSMDELSIYQKMLNSSYSDIVAYLLKKNGKAKQNYFKDTNCTVKNANVSRTSEGLYCHHIDEDKAILLSNDKFAAANPFDYQKANRLVYCNLLEHLLLHVKIAEQPSEQANQGELPGIGGAINFICKDLNDIYAGKEFADEWHRKVAALVKDDFDDYIAILQYLWNVVEQNPTYKAIITKEMLCVGWDGKVVPTVLNALNGHPDAENIDD